MFQEVDQIAPGWMFLGRMNKRAGPDRGVCVGGGGERRRQKWRRKSRRRQMTGFNTHTNASVIILRVRKSKVPHSLSSDVVDHVGGVQGVVGGRGHHCCIEGRRHPCKGRCEQLIKVHLSGQITVQSVLRQKEQSHGLPSYFLQRYTALAVNPPIHATNQPTLRPTLKIRKIKCSTLTPLFCDHSYKKWYPEVMSSFAKVESCHSNSSAMTS